ncbi:protein of unknown function [Meinhardsimonia xiamenensis]|uniref:DUF4167 domain-containing protein n=2 Tax=Meinhardsimonia xiamenensis TaxID=990712 RepID=A0A1G9BFI8_9RHOB|nr:uncharacterized protein DUF4167 [Meinhardsimonia xiamenensis]SDK38298.1 protein of unknown function [Meinhardsimonia xiamenensis]
MGNIVNRVFESSGPEGKVRGTPQQIIEKYNQLARDAQLANDRVAMENFQQHAEHYMRLLNEALREQEARREAQEAQARERREAREARNAAPADEGAGGIPDVIDMDDEETSGLVETPEAAVSEPPPAGQEPAAEDAEAQHGKPEDPPQKPARRRRSTRQSRTSKAASAAATATPAETGADTGADKGAETSSETGADTPAGASERIENKPAAE